MKTKTQKTPTNPNAYADELMAEYYGPLWGSGIKKKRKNATTTRKR